MHKLLLTTLLFVQLFTIINAQTTVQFTPSQDNSIFSELPNNSNGLGELFSGEICNVGHRRALMQFDLSGLPCGATVTSVTLTLVVDMVPPNIPTSNYTLNKLLTAWGEGTSSGSGQGAPAVAPDATWNDAKFGTNTWTLAGGDFNAASATTTMTAGTGTQTFLSTATLVSDVQSWINTPSTNFGWILIGDEATVCTARRIGSKDIGTKPVLQVTYTIPSASFNYSASSYCVNASDPTPTITGTAGGTFSSTPAGLSINTNSGLIDVSASTPATYSVTYTAPGNCTYSTNQSVTINALSNASFNYGAASYCVNGTDPTPTITGLAGGTFSSTPAGLSLNISTGKITLNTSTPTIYNVTYSVTGTCPNSVSHSVTINALSNASFNYGAASYCVNAADPTPTITGLAGGIFSSTPAGLSLNTSTGKVTLNTSTPATYNVIYSVTGTCPNSVSHSVTISALSNAGFNYGTTSYCTNGTDPTPTITGLAGGTFSSTPAGLSLNTSTGKITLNTSSPATYNVTYSVTGTCPNSVSHSVTIISSINSSFNYSGASYCVNGADPTPTITGQAGGTFSSTPVGLSLNTTTGKITLNTSTPATYNVTYAVTGTCPSLTSHSVTINSLSNASFNYGSPSYCVNGVDPTPTITGLAGGVFSSAPAGLILNTSTGKITLLTSTPGIYNVTYAVTGTCPNSVSNSVTVNALSNANFNYSSVSYCISSADPTPTVTGQPGGKFTSSPSGMIIDSVSGLINLSASSPGIYSITYTTIGTCPNSNSQSVSIVSGNAGFHYSSASYCRNEPDPTPIITGDTAGGFSSFPAGLIIDSITGTINISLSSIGTYSVTYKTTGLCPDSTTQSVTINNSGSAGFSYSVDTFCTNASNPSPIISGQSGGIFIASPSGIVLDSATGVIDLSLSTQGNYSVTYTISGVCSSVSTQPVTINSISNADFLYSSTSYCNYGADETPVITGLPGGYFTSSPTGLVLDSTTGTIQLNASIQGTYNITYTTIASCPNSTNQLFTITSIDTLLTLNLQTLTANDSNATYQWLICPALTSIAGEINQSFTPTSGGSYAVILSKNGCMDTSNCYNVTFVNIDENSFYDNITVFPNPTNDEVAVQLKYFYETIDVTVNDILGNKIDVLNFSSTNIFQFHLDAPSGIYFLDIHTNTGQHFYFKIIKE